MAKINHADCATPERDACSNLLGALDMTPLRAHRKSGGVLRYTSCESRVPKDHPLRAIRAVADEVIEILSAQLEELNSKLCNSSIEPAKLLRSLLLERLYSIRSERQLIEQLGYNLLFRWFVGLPIDAPQWDLSVFTKSRELLVGSGVAAQFLAVVLGQPRVASLLSSCHFSVDRAVIEDRTNPNSLKRRCVRAESPQPESDAEEDLYGENGERMPYYPARPRQQYL